MKILKSSGVVILLLVIVVLIYGSIIEPRLLLDSQRSEVEIPQLPSEWEGKKIALLADFQIGMWWDNQGMVVKAVDRIIEENIDLVLIAGDLVYKPDSLIVKKAVSLLQPLSEAQVPVFVVLGNHDYSLMKKESSLREEYADLLQLQLENIGINVLRNENYNLNNDGSPLFIVGLDSEWADKCDPEQAMKGIPAEAARIVLMHNPVSYRDFAPHSAPFTLAAHTHGGQIRLPGLPSESWLDIAREREVVAEGWSSEKIDSPGNRLYVNRGLGFSLIPIRFLCRPELSIFTLKRANGSIEDKSPGQAE